MASAESSFINFSQHFLIAMPGMEDSDFARSVVYVCEHTEQGALGLCINKPQPGVLLPDLFAQLKMPLKRTDLQDLPVCWGGPVQPERGFVLHHQYQKRLSGKTDADDAGKDGQDDAVAWHYTSSLRIADGLQMTTSRDILEALAEGGGPAPLFVTLGYSAWGRGQLESEVLQNSWLTVPANQALIFDIPLDVRYEQAMQLLGVTPGSLAVQAGRA